MDCGSGGDSHGPVAGESHIMKSRRAWRLIKPNEPGAGYVHVQGVGGRLQIRVVNRKVN